MPSSPNPIINGSTIVFSTQENSKYIANERENIKTDLIKITRDKLENILLKHLNILKFKVSWATPFSLFISTLTTLLTTDFKDFLLKKEIWNAIFILLMIFSGVWFIVNIILLIKNHKKASIDFLIDKISNVRNE